MLYAEIDRRAVEGVDKPVIYKGEITGTYMEYSDNLLKFRRKQRDPSYRDNYTTETTTNKTDNKIAKITVRRVNDRPTPELSSERPELPEEEEEVRDE